MTTLKITCAEMLGAQNQLYGVVMDRREAKLDPSTVYPEQEGLLAFAQGWAEGAMLLAEMALTQFSAANDNAMTAGAA